MTHAPLTDLNSKLLARMRAGSEVHAPWAVLPDAAWQFIEHALEAGIQWKTATCCLDRWLVPETNTERRRQQSAMRPGQFQSQPPFLSGIGLVCRHYIGGMTGHGWEGGAPNYYSATTSRVPGEYEDLACALGLFWPDMPALLWEQVRPLLSVRTQETDEESFGGSSDYAVDNIDALKLFRFLDSHGKTRAVQPLIDWKRIVEPGGPVIAPSLGGSALRQENGVVVVG